MAVYEYGEEMVVTHPGEIICSGDFYDYEAKYGTSKQTQTLVKAPGLSSSTLQKIKENSLKAFQGLKMRHLARLDFFLDSQENLFLNEPNTFPGHTSISLFPSMMRENGHEYHQFLELIIKKETAHEH